MSTMAADASMKDNLDKLIESISQDSTMAVVLNKDGNILFANKELGRFLRCKPEEMAGKNWVDNYIPPVNRENAAIIFQSIVSDSKLPVERYINTVLTARGEERVIYWQNGIVRDNQGGIIYVVIYGKDITERAQLEEVLLLSEKDKNIILNSLTDSIVYQDMDHRILWANEAAGKGVDERPENMIGQKCYRIIQKADRPCAGCPIILARTTGQPHELLHMNYFGKVFHLRAYPVFDENKQITGAVEISTDVTERQKADKTLVESEQRFRDIARAAAEFIWETDKQGRFSYLTDRAHIILDRKLSDILNHKSFDFMSPAEAKRMYKILAGYQSQKQPFYNLEHKFLRPDGSEIWVRVSGVPMFDTNGEFTGYRGAGAEITA
jgi:PAS domain S-box-containing protein